MKLSNQAIKQIAEELDIGMICYIHKETKECHFLIDTEHPDFDDASGLWDEAIKKVKDHMEQYIELRPMRSSEAFQIMKKFAQQVDHDDLERRLFNALNRRKPFPSFRRIVDDYVAKGRDIRQEWFDFRDAQQQEWVRRELRYLEDC